MQLKSVRECVARLVGMLLPASEFISILVFFYLLQHKFPRLGWERKTEEQNQQHHLDGQWPPPDFTIIKWFFRKSFDHNQSIGQSAGYGGLQAFYPLTRGAQPTNWRPLFHCQFNVSTRGQLLLNMMMIWCWYDSGIEEASINQIGGWHTQKQ